MSTYVTLHYLTTHRYHLKMKVVGYSLPWWIIITNFSSLSLLPQCFSLISTTITYQDHMNMNAFVRRLFPLSVSPYQIFLRWWRVSTRSLRTAVLLSASPLSRKSCTPTTQARTGSRTTLLSCASNSPSN